MAETEDHSDVAVAELNFRHALHPGEDRTFVIRPNDEFEVGRKDIQDAWGTIEQTISTHHLRFRCIIYDDDAAHVAPLIYVRVLSSNPVRLAHPDVNHLFDDVLITRDSGDVLLNHGDALHLTRTISILFHDDSDVEEALTPAQESETANFADRYLMTNRMLGAGGQACVFVAVKQSTREQIACKIVPIRAPESDANASRAEDLLRKRKNLAREYHVLKNLDHPNIIGLEKVFCATYNIYILQELITGGDLHSYVVHMGQLTEPESAVIVRQILKAVEFLHNNEVVHRDIKPENILMTSWRQGTRVVLSDFGQARTIGQPKSSFNSAAVCRMQTVVGTNGYTAPEVFEQTRRHLKGDKGYGKGIDIWSVGCITAILLAEELYSPDRHARHAAADRGPNTQICLQCWDLGAMDRDGAWREVGRKAKSFIRECLILDESQRLTAEQALSHVWFTNKHYAAELEGAYARAIADWKPRNKSGDLIEYINSTNTLSLNKRTNNGYRKMQETKSHHFSASPLPEPPRSGKMGHFTSWEASYGIGDTALPTWTQASYTPLPPPPPSDSLAEQSHIFASPIQVPDTPPAARQPAPKHTQDRIVCTSVATDAVTCM